MQLNNEMKPKCLKHTRYFKEGDLDIVFIFKASRFSTVKKLLLLHNVFYSMIFPIRPTP